MEVEVGGYVIPVLQYNLTYFILVGHMCIISPTIID